MSYRHPETDEERSRYKRMEYLRTIGVGGFTPAGPVQKRVRYLHDRLGLSFEQIAQRSGVDVETVKMHHRGHRWDDNAPVEVCTKATERGILGARFQPGEGYWFPAFGVRRRLHALQAAGFNLECIATVSGKPLRDVNRMMTGGANTLRPESARVYIAAYEKLEHTDPADWGVSQFASRYNKGRAAKHGYAPPWCWDIDTIDDPDAHPEWTGACGTPEGLRIHYRDRIPTCQACLDSRERKPFPAAGSVKSSFSGTKLTRIRERQGMSIKGLAFRLGVDKGTVYYWETGRSAPRDQARLDQLTKVLGCLDTDLMEDE